MKDLFIRKGYSPKTSKNYLSHISRFLEYSEDLIEMSDVNRYMVYILDERKLSHSYCNQAINAIKVYLRIFGEVNEEQLIKMERPKKEQKLPKVLAKSEVKDLITTTKNEKHKTALMIAYSCGLRVSEVAELKVSDIDSKRMIIRINQSKGRKDRIIKLSTILLDQLRVYYKLYKPKEWLFESQKGDWHISARTLQKVFREQADRVGIRKSATFHSIRHSYATHMLETGVDIRFIQEFLGHSDIKTTQIYLSVSTQSMDNIPNPLDLL
jgi:site-specific recombinase XerD